MSYQEQTTQNQTVDNDRDERLATHDLFDTAAADGNFTRFLAAISGSDLESLLHGPDLYTVCAPLNAAFDRLDTGDISSLIPGHIARGALTAAEIKIGRTLKTIAGTTLPTGQRDGAVRVGNATIVRPDIECTNGVLHAIDTILLPE